MTFREMVAPGQSLGIFPKKRHRRSRSHVVHIREIVDGIVAYTRFDNSSKSYNYLTQPESYFLELYVHGQLQVRQPPKRYQVRGAKESPKVQKHTPVSQPEHPIEYLTTGYRKPKPLPKTVLIQTLLTRLGMYTEKEARVWDRHYTRETIIEHIRYYNTYGIAKPPHQFDPVAERLRAHLHCRMKAEGIYGYLPEWQLNGQVEQCGLEWQTWVTDTFTWGFIPESELLCAYKKIDLLVIDLAKTVTPKTLELRQVGKGYCACYEMLKNGKETYLIPIFQETRKAAEKEVRQHYKIVSLSWISCNKTRKGAK